MFVGMWLRRFWCSEPVSTAELSVSQKSDLLVQDPKLHLWDPVRTVDWRVNFLLPQDLVDGHFLFKLPMIYNALGKHFGSFHFKSHLVI
jgi:hypothetical protein